MFYIDFNADERQSSTGLNLLSWFYTEN